MSSCRTTLWARANGQALGLERTGFQQPSKEYMKRLEAFTF